MRVLAHIHTLNDEAVIEQLVEGLRRQTRPPDAIIIVDNGSTDKTLDRTFPENVTIVRNSRNLGTSGGVRAGLAHGLEHGFDWTWLFDADSVPEPDALENLLDFYQSLASSEQDRTCFLACRLANAEGEVRHRPMMFSGSNSREHAGQRQRYSHFVRLLYLDRFAFPDAGGRNDWTAFRGLRP